MVEGTFGNRDQERGVHVFADFSNLFGGARALGAERGERIVRVHAENMLRLLADGRPIAAATAIVNTSVTLKGLAAFGRCWTVLPVEPGVVSHREQFADQALQMAMIETLGREPRANLVLATGDGAGAREGVGFLFPLGLVLGTGGTFEVASFSKGLSRTLEGYAKKNGRFRLLDPHYDEITFVPSERWARTPRIGFDPVTDSSDEAA